MPGGRPPVPIELKRQKGDTRQRGANKFAESLGKSHVARRGRPPMPSVLTGAAKRHWKYIADALEAERLLSVTDEGMLTTLALLYAGIMEAGAPGEIQCPHCNGVAQTPVRDPRTLAELSQRYGQFADRMGLNESARVKLPRGEKPSDPLEDALCG